MASNFPLRRAVCAAQGKFRGDSLRASTSFMDNPTPDGTINFLSFHITSDGIDLVEARASNASREHSLRLPLQGHLMQYLSLK
ncbi:unnamed protein product [Danaus chrysippus]|uniref:(African queen) hypothetical protein n=1 Tax=Danaus chrysippus TaxID=151541 RepID=A0A8J2VW39_9NEOP|nr:unnamed protein product [Danaus chrysippus]